MREREREREREKKNRQKYLITLILFIALEIILAFSAFGFIIIPPISVSFLPIPVIMGAYLLGPFAGATLGCVFGLTSMWKASTSAIEYADIVFSPFLSGKPVESLILSLATRIIFGYVSGAAFSFIKKINCSKINIVITATSVNIFHSLLIYSCLHLFFPESNITIFYGIKRLISLNNITTCLICSYLTILLNEFVKQNKKMNYLN